MPHRAAATPEVTAAQLAHAGVHLDEQEDAQARRQEQLRWNTRVYPRMRVVGFAVLSGVVLLHALLVRSPDSWPAVILFVVGSELYALLSWAALRRWFGREPWQRPDLSDIFFAVDLALWAAAIYVTGAERSWLFFLPLLRAADQAHGGVRRTLLFAHLGVLAYLGMLAWVVAVDGRVPAPGPEGLKLVLLWIGGLYMAMSAAPAERKRRQMELAVRFSRGLVQRMETRARDLAEQTRQAHALRQEVEETARNRVRVLSGASHELRTPLNHVLGFAQLLELEDLTESQREAVDGISSGGRRLLRLVDRILEITGGEAESGEREP
ncbi:MAG TPA: histidine kinase dimerization/phospho-acceptor domain-containing protein, partial [Longimicrobiales bacterium]|nr:histidine kinase dimerization/phospho-acceptor domain-containing protein [Longimicrobiales bacterium]